MHYDGDLTMRAARARYFDANGFGDGGYDAAWVTLQAGPVPIMIPNTPQRVRSVRLHDLHHVVTEYDTNWTGEAEIAAWEIASSCADHYAAWVLNLWAFAIGLVIAPRRVFHAFVRGRHSANLFRGEFDESLLAPTVASTRQQLRLDRRPSAATGTDRVAFLAFAVAAVATLLAGAAPLILVIAALIWLLAKL